MQKTRVLFAYCHELQRSVSIDEARREFFALDKNKRKRFTFSCSDRQCNVAVTGVNYHIKAEDGPKYKAAHFRSHIPHKFGCEWIEFTDETVEGMRPGESEQDFSERKSRQKLKDYITSFDPSVENKAPAPNENRSGSAEDAEADPSKSRSSSGADSHRWSQYTRTNQLQRLIDFWQEAQSILPPKEFRALQVNIVNHGKVSLSRYVSHIQNGLTNQYGGVVHGGASLIKRYGKGFLIQFFDKKNNVPVRLYVSKDIMNRGGFGHYVDEVLNTPEVRYFRIFLLNPTVKEAKNSAGKEVIELEISKLRQLAIYCELKHSSEDEPESSDSDGTS